MIHSITHLKDILGNNYLGVDIPQSVVFPFLGELKELIGADDYEAFTKAQIARDRSHYHLTVLNVAEYNRLAKDMGIDGFVNSLDPILKYEIDDMKMLGLGRAEKGEDIAFFVVCRSEKIDAIRERYSLDKKDLHITLGFKHRDVFGIRKNEVLKKGGKFIQLLGQEFYKMENWNFVKDISGFDSDRKADVVSVEISDTVAKFRCGDDYIGVAYIEDGEEFRIVYKYTVDQALPKIPDTEIARILKTKKS